MLFKKKKNSVRNLLLRICCKFAKCIIVIFFPSSLVTRYTHEESV